MVPEFPDLACSFRISTSNGSCSTALRIPLNRIPWVIPRSRLLALIATKILPSSRFSPRACVGGRGMAPVPGGFPPRPDQPKNALEGLFRPTGGRSRGEDCLGPWKSDSCEGAGRGGLLRLTRDPTAGSTAKFPVLHFLAEVNELLCGRDAALASAEDTTYTHNVFIFTDAPAFDTSRRV